jgi:hypothetical protein
MNQQTVWFRTGTTMEILIILTGQDLKTDGQEIQSPQADRVREETEVLAG